MKWSFGNVPHAFSIKHQTLLEIEGQIPFGQRTLMLIMTHKTLGHNLSLCPVKKRGLSAVLSGLPCTENRVLVNGPSSRAKALGLGFCREGDIGKANKDESKVPMGISNHSGLLLETSASRLGRKRSLFNPQQ
jgi:hypothetical protein